MSGSAQAANLHCPDAAQRFFAPTLVQHSSLAADGVAGLEAFVDGLPANARHELHRSVAESDLVVTHASYTGVFKSPTIGFELWRLNGGLIVEHWDGFEPMVQDTASGHSHTDGPTDGTPAGADTATNKALVKEIVQTILVENDFSNLDHYLAGEQYAQLSEGSFGGTPFAFYDLFRVADAHAVEHWDVMTAEPAPLPHENGLY